MNSSYILIHDLRVHYLHWNQGEGGIPAVLVHGHATADEGALPDLDTPPQRRVVDQDHMVPEHAIVGHGLREVVGQVLAGDGSGTDLAAADRMDAPTAYYLLHRHDSCRGGSRR